MTIPVQTRGCRVTMWRGNYEYLLQRFDCSLPRNSNNINNRISMFVSSFNIKKGISKIASVIICFSVSGVFNSI